jgi:hypothetical protein
MVHSRYGHSRIGRSRIGLLGMVHSRYGPFWEWPTLDVVVLGFVQVSLKTPYILKTRLFHCQLKKILPKPYLKRVGFEDKYRAFNKSFFNCSKSNGQC